MGYGIELCESPELSEEQKDVLVSVLESNGYFLTGEFAHLGIGIRPNTPSPGHDIFFNLPVPVGLIKKQQDSDKYKAGFCHVGEPFASEHHEKLNDIYKKCSHN